MPKLPVGRSIATAGQRDVARDGWATNTQLNQTRERKSWANNLLGAEAFTADGAKRITIIGAGIAGLVAAYELEQLGHHVEVLEGSRRIGGRIHTHRFGSSPAAPLIELGAMRIPTKHRNTMRYIAKLGLTDKVWDFSTKWNVSFKTSILS